MSLYDQIFVFLLAFFILTCCQLFKIKCKNCQNQRQASNANLEPLVQKDNGELEKRVRKKWLLSFLTFYALSALSIFITHFGDTTFNQLVKSISSNSKMAFDILLLYLDLLFIFSITYYCCYKKRGAGWLTWLIIVMPVRELMLIANGEWNQALEWNFLKWLMMLIFFVVRVCFWINCSQLLQFNSETKKQRQLALKEKSELDVNEFSENSFF